MRNKVKIGKLIRLTPQGRHGIFEAKIGVVNTTVRKSMDEMTNMMLDQQELASRPPILTPLVTKYDKRFDTRHVSLFQRIKDWFRKLFRL